MSFSANTRKVGGAVIIDMSGRLTIGEPVLLLRETIRRFIADGNNRFILNMAEVNYIDSGGLGELITNYTTIRNRQGDVKLLKLTEHRKGKRAAVHSARVSCPISTRGPRACIRRTRHVAVMPLCVRRIVRGPLEDN